MHTIVLTTDFTELPLVKRGKVRDIYDCADSLLMVVTDRLSAFDVVLPDGIPGKGAVLTGISAFWFDYVKGIVSNHLISTNTGDFPASCRRHEKVLRGRAMLVKKASPLPVECIVRGYLSGSGWKEYQKGQSVCSISLPAGLRESEKLPEPLFTPSTKAEEGHDVNISFDETVSLLGEETALRVRELSLAIYKKAAAYAESKGIIIADTKFEFGVWKGQLILIDEALTPDSSRFWLMADYEPGKSQDSFDKQIVRDYLLTLDWDKTPPGPTLPRDIVEKTSRRYREILKIIAG